MTGPTSRENQGLFDLCLHLRKLCRDAGAWGFRLEVVADGRVRADMFDDSGYSMISGEAHGDVHAENQVALDLADMARRAKAHGGRKRPGGRK